MLKSNKKYKTKPKKIWFSEDRLAYISILFTLGMGALTAYALTRVEYLSQDTDFLVAIVIVDALGIGDPRNVGWTPDLACLVRTTAAFGWTPASLADGSFIWWCHNFSCSYCDIVCFIRCRLFAAGLVC